MVGGGVGGGRWPRTEDIRRLKGWLAGFRRRCPRHARCEPFTVAGYLLEMGLRAAAPSCGGALAAAPAGSAWQRDISRGRGAPPGRAGASAVASQHEVYFMCCPCPRPICTTIAPQQGSPPFASRLGGTPRPSRATGQVCGLLASVALLFADWPTNLSLLLGWRHPRAPIGRPATLGHTVALVGGPRGGGVWRGHRQDFSERMMRLSDSSDARRAYSLLLRLKWPGSPRPTAAPRRWPPPIWLGVPSQPS